MLNQIKKHQQPKILLVISDCPSRLNINKLLSADFDVKKYEDLINPILEFKSEGKVKVQKFKRQKYGFYNDYDTSKINSKGRRKQMSLNSAENRKKLAEDKIDRMINDDLVFLVRDLLMEKYLKDNELFQQEWNLIEPKGKEDR